MLPINITRYLKVRNQLWTNCRIHRSLLLFCVNLIFNDPTKTLKDHIFASAQEKRVELELNYLAKSDAVDGA